MMYPKMAKFSTESRCFYVVLVVVCTMCGQRATQSGWILAMFGRLFSGQRRRTGGCEGPEGVENWVNRSRGRTQLVLKEPTGLKSQMVQFKDA